MPLDTHYHLLLSEPLRSTRLLLVSGRLLVLLLLQRLVRLWGARIEARTPPTEHNHGRRTDQEDDGQNHPQEIAVPEQQQ